MVQSELLSVVRARLSFRRQLGAKLLLLVIWRQLGIVLALTTRILPGLTGQDPETKRKKHQWKASRNGVHFESAPPIQKTSEVRKRSPTRQTQQD
eukprot:3213563-Amphidinium_carterae.1